MTVSIPINFPDINDLVRDSNIHPDKIRVLLHQMYFVRISQIGGNKKNNFLKWAHDEGYVPLNRNILVSLLSTNYKKYVAFLADKSLISIRASTGSNEAYSPGFSSKHYKIDPELFHLPNNPNHFRKETITDNRTIKAVLKTQEQYQKNKVNNPRSIPLDMIQNSFYEMEQKVTFDIKGAQNWVSDHLSCLSEESLPISEMDKISTDLGDQVELIKSINEGCFDITIDVFGHRLHTPLKRVSRQLRPFMIIDGYKNDEIVCLDIANSQVYFSTLLINSTIVNKIIPEFSIIAEYSADYAEKCDFKDFVSTSTDGTIYDVWKNLRNFTSRDAAKTEFIEIIFSKRNSRMPGIQVFKKVYPSVWKFFDKIKSLTEKNLLFISQTYLDRNGIYEPDNYHKNLSCAVQRLESRIFIKIICKSLLDNGIKPFFTIHDSVYFPAKFYTQANDIIKEEFTSLGINAPKLKTSKVQPELNKKQILL